MYHGKSTHWRPYILEIIEQVGHSFAFGVGKDIVVVYFGAACTRVYRQHACLFQASEVSICVPPQQGANKRLQRCAIVMPRAWVHGGLQQA